MPVAPATAAVRPRVIDSPSGESFLLEDRIRALLSARERGPVYVLGRVGMGKSSALSHLAAVFAGESSLQFLDNPTEAEFSLRANDGRSLVVYCRERHFEVDHVALFALVPWTPDDVIEYLLARHKPRCRVVMERMKSQWSQPTWVGVPEFAAQVLDILAEQPSIADTRSAVVLCIDRVRPSPRQRRRATDVAWSILTTNAMKSVQPQANAKAVGNAALERLLQYRPVQFVLAEECLLSAVMKGGNRAELKARLPRELVEDAARLIAGEPKRLKQLHMIFAAHRDCQPTAAEISLAADRAWRPETKTALRLTGARLSRAEWPGVRLSDASLVGAELNGANLANADLNGAQVDGASLVGANLSKAIMCRLRATLANFERADLSCAFASAAVFDRADLTSATLQSAMLADASFIEAKATRCNFIRANLRGARFAGAELEHADFSHADLSEAYLSGLALRVAEFRGARFHRATMTHCDLEYMRLPAADFCQSFLAHSNFTASCIPDGDFRDADLIGAGLAEVDWERADLRGANLKGATFHLGSSRSGLVFSPIASEGSRTGFYTDEFGDHEFRPPEDVRKANLRGANLIGAELLDVDFYLVDLRDAVYEAGQEAHFRKCGAILESRVR